MIELTPRLSAVARFVTPGAVLADIGTDHAYLPAYLIEQGVITSAFACDINEGPLQNARKTIERCGINSVEFVLGSGLHGLEHKNVTQFVIAGMGGEMIASILEQSPWCKAQRYTFVLQPMTKIDFLRKFLYREGFEITEETLVAEADKLYTVMKVRYTGERCEVSEAFALLGKAGAHPLFEQKRQREIERLRKIYDALNNTENARLSRDEILKLIKEIEEYTW